LRQNGPRAIGPEVRMSQTRNLARAHEADRRPGRDDRPDGWPRQPSWEPNWLPTTIVAQPHLATLGLVIAGQMVCLAASGIIKLSCELD
jgi:hypothetical protein